MFVPPTGLSLDETVLYGGSSCDKRYVQPKPGYYKYMTAARKPSIILKKKKLKSLYLVPLSVGSIAPTVTNIRAYIIDQQKEDDYYFKKWEFFLLLLFMDSTNRRMADFERMMFKYGLVTSVVYYVLHTFFIEFPIRVFLIFIASFSQKHALQVFECMPLLKAFGYTTLMSMFVTHIKRIQLSFLNVMMMYEVLADTDWMHCENVDVTSNKTCVPMNNTVPRNTECPLWPWKQDRYYTHMSATQYYVRLILPNKIIYSHIVNTIVTILIQSSIFIIPTTICILFKRNSHKCIKTHTVIGIICYVTTIAFLAYTRITLPRLVTLDEFPYEVVTPGVYFWTVTNLFNLHSNFWLIPMVIFVSTHKPPDLSPEKAGLISCLLRLISAFCFFILEGVVLTCVNSHYNFPNSNCVLNKKHEILDVLMTDLVARTYLNKIWLFCWIAFMLFTKQVYYSYLLIVAAFAINQITEKFKNRWALLSFSISAVVGLVTVTLIQFELVYDFDDEDIYWILLNGIHMTAFAWGIPFLYTIKQIREDYLFQYGVVPNKYWVTALDIMPYFTLVFFIKGIFERNDTDSCRTDRCIYTSLTYLLICLAIHLIVILMQMIKKFVFGDALILTLPGPSWGPYDPIMRTLRRCYMSERDIKWKYELPRCKHACLLHSRSFWIMRDRQNVTTDEYLSQFDRFSDSYNVE